MDEMDGKQNTQQTLTFSCANAVGRLPREIDIEAEERFDELDEIYRKDHPRPTEFNAIRKWEKERLMTLEHQVMEEIVYKRRE